MKTVDDFQQCPKCGSEEFWFGTTAFSLGATEGSKGYKFQCNVCEYSELIQEPPRRTIDCNFTSSQGVKECGPNDGIKVGEGPDLITIKIEHTEEE